jgi:hypothetical protein
MTVITDACTIQVKIGEHSENNNSLSPEMKELDIDKDLCNSEEEYTKVIIYGVYSGQNSKQKFIPNIN